MEPKMAGEIAVRRDGLTIDGEEFPWYVLMGGVRIDSISKDDVPTVTVTIMAERVLVDNDMRRPG